MKMWKLASFKFRNVRLQNNESLHTHYYPMHRVLGLMLVRVNIILVSETWIRPYIGETCYLKLVYCDQNLIILACTPHLGFIFCQVCRCILCSLHCLTLRCPTPIASMSGKWWTTDSWELTTVICYICKVRKYLFSDNMRLYTVPQSLSGNC